MDPFRNLTVLSLEQAMVLPHLTFRLAQDGMQVIRLEHPVYGDSNRLVGKNVLGEERMNTYYLCINAGKMALTLNLAEPEGREILRLLIEKLNVDVFATNTLPRSYEKLGIDYETLKEIKSDIIWLGVTGFGPQSNEGAYDPILQARSGLMELTGEPEDDPQVLGVPLPDMGAAEHAYGRLMKALYTRAVTGEGSCINLSMFESSVSWLTVPIPMSTSFGEHITRTGNTHQFFCPVSVYETKDGHVYLALGTDRQWKSMVTLEPFKSLDKPEYEKNAGRIRDVENLNRAINEITRRLTSEQMIELFNSITAPISKIKSIPEVVTDPLTEKGLLFSQDPITKTRITMAPPPNMTSFLEAQKRELSFPPRFGEHNHEIYGQRLGYSEEDLRSFKEKGII
jgi:formyl-CoA transferase